ncbi:MAG: glycosyltransferase [Spirochaetota bacterium]|nr:MAG: glycosyltransferase [Spirochaetota bacterium]
MVSIIIPTYNRISFLKKALDSVFSQTFLSYELIVVDDGSTDGTEDYIHSLARDIHYIKIPHSGVSRARNVGIDSSRCEWIAFLDSDDYWLSEKLEKQLQYLKDHPEYRICHTDEIWIKNGVRINQGKKHKKREGWFFIPSLDLCLISPSSVIIHRNVFQDTGMFDESFDFVEDYELWLRITSKYPIGYIDEKLVVKIGGHSDQLSSHIDGIERYRIRALEKIIKDYTITEDFRNHAALTYKKKCSIYITGCHKRNKLDEIQEIQARMEMVLSH